jgi:hypothetical protein
MEHMITFKLMRVLAFGMVAFVLVSPWAPARKVAAFTYKWTQAECWGPEQHGLWDDAPGAGLNNENAFFWMSNSSTRDESCTYSLRFSGGPVSTDRANSFRVRAAVNDGAILRVALYGVGAAEFPCSGEFITAFVTLPTEDQSKFIWTDMALPPGKAVGEVCITLDDDPNTSTAARTSALIDDIKMYNPVTRYIAFRETFSAPN